MDDAVRGAAMLAAEVILQPRRVSACMQGVNNTCMADSTSERLPTVCTCLPVNMSPKPELMAPFSTYVARTSSRSSLCSQALIMAFVFLCQD